jgi:hypothetical protein
MSNFKSGIYKSLIVSLSNANNLPNYFKLIVRHVCWIYVQQFRGPTLKRLGYRFKSFLAVGRHAGFELVNGAVRNADFVS